ncbi:MAG: insulinase family protein, partial [Candidatus Neomarinimicrobiota bacterium]
KAGIETGFYNSIGSVNNKAFQLAQYNEFNGSPAFIGDDLKNILAVTSQDIRRVYQTYIKDQPFVLTSFVPYGRTDLVTADTQPYELEPEIISAHQIDNKIVVEQIPTKFDRTVEPSPGPDPELVIPEIWQEKFDNGLRLFGIKQDELPLVNFSLTLHGGLLLDDPEKIGVANLMSDIMMEGTATKTPLELEEAIDDLGSNISMFTSRESIVLQANCLASKFAETFALAEEILLEPRWDEAEFERIKLETIEVINRQEARPDRIAGNVFNKLICGPGNIRGNSTYGTPATLAEITIADLKNYYAANFSPSVAYITMTGAIAAEKAIATVKSLAARWTAQDVAFPQEVPPLKPERGQVYFVDVPGARQSEIRIGYVALAATDPDYYPANVMNYALGGSFNGIVNMILREEKGYTYGARTGFSGTTYPGAFSAYAGVQSDATLESVQIFRAEMEKYRQPIAESSLAFTKAALVKSNARRFETLAALMGMLNQIAAYDFPHDYWKDREQVIRNMTIAEHTALAQKYIDPDRMIYLVVGDAATQLEPLKDLGFGNPVLLDKTGNIAQQ